MQNKIKIYALVAVIICVLNQGVYADEYFAVYYGYTTWEEEQLHLDQLGIFLSRDSESIGYIGFFLGEKDKLKDIERRMKRAKKYLIKRWKISDDRINIINAGKSEITEIILQPQLKSLPPPKFGEDNS